MLTTKVFVVEFKPFLLLLHLADHLMRAILHRKWVDLIFKWPNCRRVILAHIGVFYFYLGGKSDSNSNFPPIRTKHFIGATEPKTAGRAYCFPLLLAQRKGLGVHLNTGWFLGLHLISPNYLWRTALNVRGRSLYQLLQDLASQFASGSKPAKAPQPTWKK
jgi:hypothetical protein